jgi:hypothetical protein
VTGRDFASLGVRASNNARAFSNEAWPPTGRPRFRQSERKALDPMQGLAQPSMIDVILQNPEAHQVR